MKQDNLPKELEYFSKHKVLSVTFAQNSDNSTTGNAPSGYQVKRLVKMDTGKLVVPMFLIKQPRKGAFRKVYQANAWVEVLVAVGQRHPLFHLPIDRRIRKQLLLLRPIVRPAVVSDAAWRVFEFDAAELNGSDELRFPEFKTLPALNDRPDGTAVQKQIDAAIKARTTFDLWAT